MLENTESQEMYLTTIYALQKKNGMVRSVDVADERGYSKVSVHNAMKRLEEFGYVTFHQGKITLTKCGTKGLTETQLKLTQAKQVSRYGMGGLDINGLIRGCEKSVLGLVWGRDKYWEVPELQTAHIVIIKQAINSLIEAAFAERGQISMGEVYDYLQDEFGFSPCNLSAFVTGFLLKEYGSDPYRCIDAEGYPDAMTPDKLAEMIGNYIRRNETLSFQFVTNSFGSVARIFSGNFFNQAS